MAAAGYGTIATWKSMFGVPDADVDATRFGHMNIHAGRKFNFYITADSETDIIATTVTGMLAEETHQLIFELFLRSKSSKVTNPWEQMTIELGLIDFKERFKNLIKHAQKILYGDIISIGDLHFGYNRS